jgi:hypothetical protein
MLLKIKMREEEFLWFVIERNIINTKRMRSFFRLSNGKMPRCKSSLTHPVSLVEKSVEEKIHIPKCLKRIPVYLLIISFNFLKFSSSAPLSPFTSENYVFGNTLVLKRVVAEAVVKFLLQNDLCMCTVV